MYDNIILIDELYLQWENDVLKVRLYEKIINIRKWLSYWK